jgi:hypothetical protein
VVSLFGLLEILGSEIISAFMEKKKERKKERERKLWSLSNPSND